MNMNTGIDWTPAPGRFIHLWRTALQRGGTRWGRPDAPPPWWRVWVHPGVRGGGGWASRSRPDVPTAPCWRRCTQDAGYCTWRYSSLGRSVSPQLSRKHQIQAVLRIRIRIQIHRIHMFLGLLDPDPSVKGMVPDPYPDLDPSITSKKSKKNLDSYCFVTSFWLFIFKNDVLYLQDVISKKKF